MLTIDVIASSTSNSNFTDIQSILMRLSGFLRNDASDLIVSATFFLRHLAKCTIEISTSIVEQVHLPDNRKQNPS